MIRFWDTVKISRKRASVAIPLDSMACCNVKLHRWGVRTGICQSSKKKLSELHSTHHEAMLMPKGTSATIHHDNPAHPFHESVEMETVDRENKPLGEISCSLTGLLRFIM